MSALTLGARRRGRRLLAPAARRMWRWPTTRPDHRPRRATVVAGLVAGSGAAVAGGPVAAVVVAVYAALAMRSVLGRRRRRWVAEVTAGALDAVAVLAADLRAGAAPGTALGAALPSLSAAGVPPVSRLVERIAGAWEVAEAAGAPLADLLDRLEADLRGTERLRRYAEAQAAGAAATAGLLAVLPVAGIGVGYAMGADPLRILLHTPVGAACAGLALLLQVAGMVWSSRLAAGIGEVD